MTLFQKASLVGLFPNRKARTCCAPGFDDFRVRSRLRAEPLEQIEDQGVYCVGHSSIWEQCLLAGFGSAGMARGMRSRPKSGDFGY
jgi:hypothetical protein